MDIDISVLRLMEREKDSAFRSAWPARSRTPCSPRTRRPRARVHGRRVDLNRKTGHVTVMAPGYDADGQQIGEYDNTPAGVRTGGGFDRPPGDHAAATRRRGRAKIRSLLRCRR